MFGKRKNEVFDTAYDLAVKRLADEVGEAAYRISERVEKVMVRLGVIELYPEGADKEKAKRDAETSRQSLLNAVAIYDDLANQYEKAIAQNDRQTTLDYKRKLLTSHELIEIAYKRKSRIE